ncbi:DNA alkylation repair protein [Paenibacillus methanolicus]|uniref:3-methyladenine DNA glycosylase AlkD n=1 Tax=Paenibacillus methanolicus TaxID=582686 RepID=A0A5S5C853_9BACL|nr:DNA alkylation repair protein [Paenibacillus methanolicus]TYP75585.1 3-methyladenine DNA glycosylase AlkD [Paenibacillus methanolicus]
MLPYTSLLAERLSSHADPAVAAPMAAYMRDQFPFLGLKNPERVALTRAFLAEHGLPAGEAELLQVAEELWSLPQREFQYTAMLLLEKRLKHAQPERMPLLERLITTKSWWDTVDILAGKLAGSLFARYPDLVDEYISKWTASDDMWLNRSALLFQLHYKERTDRELLFALVRRYAGHEDFFIRKAIGWALREYSKTDAASVTRLVEETLLSPLSAREALKWLRGQDAIDD